MVLQMSEISVGPEAAEASLSRHVREAFALARRGVSRLDPMVLAIPGMSGRCYRMFVNNLIGSLPEPRYLEVGTWAGSTLCAAINGNRVHATAIDNWSQFGGPREAFQANLTRFATPQAFVRFIQGDFRQVDYRRIDPCDVYMFDGPHETQDQYEGVALALPALKPCFVLIVDDWNWQKVRDGTWQALEALHIEVLHSLEVRTSIDDTHPEVAFQQSDWHNGYFIGTLRKPV
jgi:hypothetical protein